MPPSRSVFERVAEARSHAPNVEMEFSTRAKVEPPRRFACHRCGKAAPCARPARRKGDRAGRSPGLRVVTLAPPSQAFAQWRVEEGSPPTVAGAAPDLTRFFAPHRIPSWPAEAGTPAPGTRMGSARPVCQLDLRWTTYPTPLPLWERVVDPSKTRIDRVRDILFEATPHPARCSRKRSQLATLSHKGRECAAALAKLRNV